MSAIYHWSLSSTTSIYSAKEGERKIGYIQKSSEAHLLRFVEDTDDQIARER